ncbi:uncharacterized protein PV07_12665 [Cladophialophora immunda]|uniref:Uncharacterized protein n=1 Tax=Cladophialophora immunda TaxID=569365 RepID=A0A0D2CEF8_9EURO|nr:uncharacterized protein PV07_12665 [Cladophialophora immunda]KIW21924.1 hypothetical protein PV07_12665 [Cladophialophora immunda]
MESREYGVVTSSSSMPRFSKGHILAIEYAPIGYDAGTARFFWAKKSCDGSIVDLSIFQDHLIACTATDITVMELSRHGDPFASRTSLKLSQPSYSMFGGFDATFWLSSVRLVDLNGTAYLMAVQIGAYGRLYVLGTEWPREALAGDSCSLPKTDKAGSFHSHWRNLPTLLDPDGDSRWMDKHAWADDGGFQMLSGAQKVLEVSYDGVVVVRASMGGWWMVHLLTWRVEQYDDIAYGQSRSLVSNPSPPTCALTCEPEAQARGQYVYVNPERPRLRHQTTEIGDPTEIGARPPFKKSSMGGLPPEILLLVNDEVGRTGLRGAKPMANSL